MEQAFINWSGGKDCTLALHKVKEQGKLSVAFLFTTLSREHKRVTMHGVRKELITRQAMSVGVHSRKLYLPEDSSMETYNRFIGYELHLMKQRGIEHAICGDIFLEDLKTYRETKLGEVGINAEFPLWKNNTVALLREFIQLGYKAIIVAVDAKKLDASFLGRELDEAFLAGLPDDVDPCGENGEFHTFVYDGPIFQHPVSFKKGEVVLKTYIHNGEEHGFWFLDLLPDL